MPAAGYSETSRTVAFGGCFDDTAPQQVPPDMSGGGGILFYLPDNGGGNSNWTPDPPYNPADGDTYAVTDASGKTTISVFNAQTNKWEWLQILLPAVTVASNPSQYNFLVSVPTDFKILGQGNLTYSFDDSILAWRIYCILNKLTTPCLVKTANKVTNQNLTNKLNDLLQEIFNSNNKVNLVLQEGTVPGAYGATGITNTGSNGAMTVSITLDPNKFVGSSQEFVGATIIHEAFHAIVLAISNNNYSEDDHHIAMYTNYLNLLADSLQESYPNMGLGDAKALILKGLLNLDGGSNPTDQRWKTSFVDKVLNHSGLSRDQINLAYTRYQTYHTSGTNCN